ncbi:MAG: YggS family pyridoxal phosphate-dependent enzyme [Oscillospiraceae bacterium]|nr:YggS family pyridoxal phosphate-dependent enzyme [Oscillospiraceae bacterium]
MTEEYARALRGNILAIRETMAEAALRAGRRPEEILLCAACKTRSPEEIRASAQLPVDCFGENHAQELERNWLADAYSHDEDGRKPCHFIGHLQTNKVKKVVGRAALIQSLDSERLADAVDACAARLGLVQDVLLEVNVGEEASKTGATFDGCRALLDHAAGKPNLRVRGLMTIPPVCDTEDEARRWFARMRGFFEELRARAASADMDVLSMGMSGDYAAAILEGSTMVRIGSAVYGPRFYPPKSI